MKQTRKGKTVAVIGDHEGKPCTLETKTYDSINLAKKANGLNAKTLKRGEHFPPTVAEALAEVRKAA